MTSVAGVATTCLVGNDNAHGKSSLNASDHSMGVLVDMPQCIGCRKCEFACQQAEGADVPPINTFEDKTVFDSYRRPSPECQTVVNRFPNPDDADRPVYSKINCLHCLDPACVSACLVGALQRQDDGSVTYDASKCMGCRYCMVACPFQIPSYEYDDAWAPRVRKCTLCFGRFDTATDAPACVKICPNDALVYGKRSELLQLAHDKIDADPDRYVNHVYGEHEAGGTSWLYLSSVPFEDLKFVQLGSTAPPRLTETIQHGVFKYFIPPLALYGVLAMIMRMGREPDGDGQRVDIDAESRAGHLILNAGERNGKQVRHLRRSRMTPSQRPHK